MFGRPEGARVEGTLSHPNLTSQPVPLDHYHYHYHHHTTAASHADIVIYSVLLHVFTN